MSGNNLEMVFYLRDWPVVEDLVDWLYSTWLRHRLIGDRSWMITRMPSSFIIRHIFLHFDKSIYLLISHRVIGSRGIVSGLFTGRLSR